MKKIGTKLLRISKAVTSLVLTLAIVLSGANAMALDMDASANNEVRDAYATFDTSKTYSIWLKESSNSADPLSNLRALRYRWNINGSGDTFNAVVHLDIQSGDNCEMRFQATENGYYGIRYDDSGYWIDTEGNNGKTGEVLHQYHDDLKNSRENQQFQFIPVSGEADTYYIVCRKGGVYIGTEENKIDQHVKIATTDQAHAMKWVIKPTDEVLLTGKETQLPGHQESIYKPGDGATVYTIAPENYLCNVNVNEDGTVVGNCLHLFYIGTSSKVTAEWVDSQEAYRLRSYDVQETILTYQVWDVDGQSLDEGAVAHVWSEKGDDHTSQLWRFIPVEGKSDVYYIYNVNSRLYLSIEGGYDPSKNDKNDVKLVQSATAFPWEIQPMNLTERNSYTSDSTSDEINPGNWMSMLPDETRLCDINIPGTHDAGAAHVDIEIATVCQQLYPDEQLNAGVRAWDLRIDGLTAGLMSDPTIVHGESVFVCLNRKNQALQLSEVMDTAKEFLESHPRETIIITLKGDGVFGSDEAVADSVLKYIKNDAYPIYRPTAQTDHAIPTLGEVRGKIVFIRRLTLSGSYKDSLNEQSKSLDYSLLDSFGPDASAWDSIDYSTCYYAQKVGYRLYVQDNYGESDANKKYKYFTGTIDNATSRNLTASEYVYLFNYSAATDNLSQPRAINQKLMNESRLNQPTSLTTRKTIGIVMTNYIDAKLSERIYMTNFATTHGGGTPINQFTDVERDWSYNGIYFCVAEGLMEGTSETTFEPEGTAARAMLVTALYRMEGEPEVGECTFSDVPADEWYTDAVIWAAENGIVEGYGGKFRPTDDITREQLVTILYRYAQYKGYDVSVGEETNILSFVDAEEIDDWAMEAMQWAVGAGLIEGKGANNLDPTGKATRAEMATILYRFCENVGE